MTDRFVGIDWGNEEHAVCVLDPAGKIVSRFTVAHVEESLVALASRLSRMKEEHDVHVAIERPNGILVERLLDAGIRVVPLHPNGVKAMRSRYTNVGAKDDRQDAYILADVLRTDGSRFPALRPSSSATQALRSLVRSRDDLVAARVETTNRLRAELEGFWLGPVAMFDELDTLIALKFLKRYPTPQSAKRLSKATLAAFLKKNRYTGSRKPEEFFARFQLAAKGRAPEDLCIAKGAAVQALVAVLRAIVEQCTKLKAQIKDQLAAHPDGELIQSFPYTGDVNAAQILAELGDDRDRFGSAEHLAAVAGLVPVTESSGARSHKKRKKGRGKPPNVKFRSACNKRLRRALTCFADNSRRASPWASGMYDAAKARGCSHPHAIRVLARAWVRILWRCWQNRETYDPDAHRGAVKQAAATRAAS